jgi:deoxyribodipyrimidine photo-lyase
VPTSLLWFRRDLRLTDHPALLAAIDAAGPDGDVVGVFVVDPRLWHPAGAPRRAFLLDALDSLRSGTDGALVLRRGDPVEVVPALVRETGAGS